MKFPPIATGLILLLASSTTSADPPDNNMCFQQVILRLDKISERLKQLSDHLEQLEHRIAQLEARSLWRDKHGIVYDATGRPVGIWGVDVPLMTY